MTYKTDSTPPSDMFVDSIGFGIGSSDMECGWCGRLHLCPDTNGDPFDYGTNNDRQEFADYCKEAHKNNPDGVILHYDVDGVSGRSLNGINFVIGCPCNGLTRFETFIWNERSTIRHYLNKRIEQEYNWAQQELTLNKLAGFKDDTKAPFYN